VKDLASPQSPFPGYKPGMCKPSTEFSCWKASLAIGFLVARSAPAFAPHLCEFLYILRQVVSFMASEVSARFRGHRKHV